MKTLTIAAVAAALPFGAIAQGHDCHGVNCPNSNMIDEDAIDGYMQYIEQTSMFRAAIMGVPEETRDQCASRCGLQMQGDKDRCAREYGLAENGVRWDPLAYQICIDGTAAAYAHCLDPAGMINCPPAPPPTSNN